MLYNSMLYGITVKYWKQKEKKGMQKENGNLPKREKTRIKRCSEIGLRKQETDTVI